MVDHFPEEVRAYRSKAPYLSLCLIVIIDTDNLSIEDRLRQLEQALEATGLAKRKAEERIVILVPNRNIETWIRYLDGNEVDETTSYPKLSREGECMAAVKRLVELYPRGGTEEAPPSMQRALVESERCSR